MTIDNFEILADRVILFKNALFPESLNLINQAEQESWTPNTNVSYGDNSIRRYETKLISSDQTIIEKLSNVFSKYAELTDRKDPGIGGEIDFHISKYSIGGMVPPHTDEAYTEDNGEHTFIIYLNGDYEGGEVGFSDYPVEVKPGAGDILAFPCFYSHYSNAVISGQKYMCISRIPFFKKDL